MPFTYYGGKKGSAHRYPPPAYSTIIEPFAGSAGYALKWATSSTRVILVESDAAVVDVWRRLQARDAAQHVAAIECPPKGAPLDDPLVGLVAASAGTVRKCTVTSRMVRDWPAQRRRLLRALPLIESWQVIEGDYTDAPDVRGVWFVDPPYAPRGDGRRPGVYHDGDVLDYAALGEWCRARRGQVIVCEQEGATWLPFRPLFVQHSAQVSGHGGHEGHPPRVEVVWTRTPGRSLPGTRRFDEQHEARRQRRRSTSQ